MNLKKTLFSKPEMFTNVHPSSPAEKAKAVWEEREGKIVVQNYNLRRLNILQLVINLLLVGAIVFLATKSSVQPFVVFANPENGEVWHVGTAEEAKSTEPTEAMKKYFMANFVKKVREIPLDPVVYKKNLTTGFSFMTRDAANKLQVQLENEKVSEKLGHDTITVNIVSIIPIEGGSSYQVRWTEEEFGIGTGQKSLTPYSGVFTAQQIKSDDEKQLAINPIGFYISDFNWSKDATAVNDVKAAGSAPGTTQARKTK